MKDELGNTNFNVFLKTHTMKNTVPQLVADGNSVWWDNVSTKRIKETRTFIFMEAFDRTINDLVTQLGTDVNKWEWGRVHFLMECVWMLNPYGNWSLKWFRVYNRLLYHPGIYFQALN